MRVVRRSAGGNWRVVALGLALSMVLVGVACGDTGGGGEGRGTTAAGAEPEAGTWKTYVLTSSSEIRVPPPPQGEEAQREQEEVEAYVRQRSAAVEEVVKRWNPESALRPWLDLNMELVAHGVKDPPLASRSYAVSSIAMYDAVVAAWHWKYEYDRKAPSGVRTMVPRSPAPSYPSEHAAIAGAASAALEYLFPEEPPGVFFDLAERAATSRVQAGVNFRSDVDAGLALGRAVAEKVIARAKADGSDRPWDGKRPPGIGPGGPEFWEPSPGSISPPTQPMAGTWKTWALSSASQFRPGPPPAYGSPEFVAQYREVMEVRARLTPQQEAIANFWSGGQGSALPPGLWNQVALVYTEGAKFDTPRAARLFAALNVAENDAALAVWDAKFTYWSPRPINVIRALGLDPSWTPVLSTPNFPGYVSGHSGYSGAAAVVLSYFFPSETKVFEDKAQEAAVSRLYGGIHIKADNEVGYDMGRKVGQVVVDRLKQDGAGA